MITRDGKQCSRNAEIGGLGFCWQHLPKRNVKSESFWKKYSIEIGVGISVASLLLEVAKTALDVLMESHGAGDNEAETRLKLVSELFPGGLFPRPVNEYQAGARVEWTKLADLVRIAKRLQSSGEDSVELANVLESEFEDWLTHMNSYHKSILLQAIEERYRRD